MILGPEWYRQNQENSFHFEPGLKATAFQFWRILGPEDQSSRPLILSGSFAH